MSAEKHYYDLTEAMEIIERLKAERDALKAGALKDEPELCKFYHAETYPQLVTSMLGHIVKLQSKLNIPAEQIRTQVRKA